MMDHSHHGHSPAAQSRPLSISPSPVCQQQPIAISTIFPANAEVTCFPATSQMEAEQRRLSGQSRPTIAAASFPNSPSPSVTIHHRQQSSEPNLHQRSRQTEGRAKNSRASQNIIVVPPREQRISAAVAGGEQSKGEEEGAKANQRHSVAKSIGANSREEEGMLVQLQQKLFENYHTVAYALIIISYFLAFSEYLYLRLMGLIFPEPIIYFRHCEKHWNEIIHRNELHFASGMVIFLVMSAYQLVCFFLLTVSNKYLEVKRTFSHVISIEERLHHELVFAIKRTMFTTLYPTFAIYLLSSSVIFCSIFYMVGLRDSVHVGSQVIQYVFDVCVILYFLAFPVLCVLFHPDINCRAKFGGFCCIEGPIRRKGGGGGGLNKNSQSFSQTTAAAKGPDEAIPTVGEARWTRVGIVHPSPTKAATAASTNAINYGSLERRAERGGGKVEGTTMPIERVTGEIEGEEKANEQDGEEKNPGKAGDEGERKEMTIQTMSNAQAASMRRKMRQRRQSRYKRLRGSDEAAECRNEEGEGGGFMVAESIQDKIRRNQEQMDEEDEGKEEEADQEAKNDDDNDNGDDHEERRRRREEEAGTKFRGLELANGEEDIEDVNEEEDEEGEDDGYWKPIRC